MNMMEESKKQELEQAGWSVGTIKQFLYGLTDDDMIQIEMAAKGCIDGTSDDWPQLVLVIEKIRGQPLRYRRSAAWLQGFCEGFLLFS